MHGQIWRHKQRGSEYRVLRIGKLQTAHPTPRLNDGDAMVVYQSLADGSVWVRSIEEFKDGRFEFVSDPGGNGK